MEGKGWTWEGEAKEWSAQVERLQAENKRLRADLGFYGFEGHWRLDALAWYWVGPATIDHDPGSIAREVLADAQPQGGSDPTREERKQ